MKKILTFILLMISATAFGQLSLINVGTNANDHTGDPLRTAFQKTNLAITQVNTNTAAILLKANIASPVFTTSVGLPALITLPSGTVLNFNAGDVTITHSANTLTLAGGTFSLPVNGLTINSKTLNLNNSLTLAGTDGTTMTFPASSATITRTDAGNTFTGHNTFEGVTATGATGTGDMVFSISPTFTSIPAAPTAAPGTNTTQLATTAFVFAGLGLKANLASPTFTGTVTIPSPFTLGATSVTTTGAQLNYSNTVTSNIQTQLNNTVDFSTIGVALADSSGGGTGHYLSGKDAQGLVPYTGANATLAMATQDITLTTGKITAQGAVAGAPNLYGYNESSTDQSSGIKGRVYYNANAVTTTFGGYFQNSADNANASGVNVGIYSTASGAVNNYAGSFVGNLKTTGAFIMGGDTCLGVQTKNILTKSYLRVTGACTLNGLQGGESGQILVIINTSATTLVLKHNGSGVQKFFISGAGDLTLATQGNSVTCLYDGTYWFIVGKGQ